MGSAVIVKGAGGHGAVVADALLCAGVTVIGFIDDDPLTHGSTLCGLPVLGADEALRAYSPDEVRLASGVGGAGGPGAGALRERIQAGLRASGWQFTTVQHPSAIVSPFARLEPGAQVLAGSVLAPYAVVGEGAIVNTSAVVDHHAVVEAWTHVAPGAVLCGNVVVGSRSHVGAGATIRQGVRIGEDTTVGSGAVVVKDCAGGTLLLGIPARERAR